MRRVIVYDDTMYDSLRPKVIAALKSINRKDVTEYSWGMNRSSRQKIMDSVLKQVPEIKFGKDVNDTGIGNNAKYEMIYTGNPEEEQIFGIIHLTDNMYGFHDCYVTDLNSERSLEIVKI